MILDSTLFVPDKPSRSPDARRKLIVATARKAFLRHGYGHTSMSSIAAALGGSKTTLWSYFRNKQELFAAVIDDLVERYGEALRMPLPEDSDPAETLQKLGESIMHTLSRPQIIGLHRLVVGEAGRFAELGQLLFERGMSRGQTRTAEWMRGQMERGTLRAADPLVAARHFVSLCQSGSFQQWLMGALPRLEADALKAEVREAVQVFMRAYRA